MVISIQEKCIVFTYWKRENNEMDFSLSSDQKQLRDEIIRFSRDYLNSEEHMESFSTEMWEEISTLGIHGLMIPEEYGGIEESYTTAAVAIEALGYGCKNNGFVFAVNNHIWVALNIINTFGTSEAKRKYIKDMVDGKQIGAIAITEADAGSDAFAMTTTVKEEENCYILNGSKMFISNGSIADIFVVFGKVVVDGKTKIASFIVEKEFAGVCCGKDIPKMGLNSCPMCEVTFHHVRIPKENLLAKIGNGSNVMTSALELERCYEFASHVGAMQRVMEKCVKYANERKQFGKPISDFQAITHKIADMRVKIELSRLMLYKIAWLKEHRKSAFLETSVFKLYVSESYIELCKDAMQIFGAYGYTKEYEIEREMRDALACSVYSGTNEMQRNTIYSLTSMSTL